VSHIEKDLIQKRIEIANWIFLAVLFVPSLIFAPLKFALGVLLGGFICIINFHELSRSLKGAFQNMGESGNIKTPVMMKFYIRLALTGIILFLLIAGGAVEIIGLIIGLSVVVINIILTLIAATILKKNSLEEVS
jgi:hypothetical protein